MGPAFIPSAWGRQHFVPGASFRPLIFVSMSSFGLHLVAPFTVRSFGLQEAFLDLFLTDEVSLPLFGGLLHFRVYVVLRFLFEVSGYYARICDGALQQGATTT